MRLLVAAIALALSLGVAHAAAPTPTHVDFSAVRCEMPQITDAIRKGVRNMRSEDGRPLLSYMGDNSALKATTISATHDKLVCRTTINMEVNGRQISLRGRYTARVLPSGKVRIEFLPGY